MKIDHIGIAVKNLAEITPFYEELLGLEKLEIEEIPEQKVRVALFKAGESKLELLEPMTEDSPIARFITKKGEGIQHLALAVEGLEEKVANLKEKGVRFIGDNISIGAGGKKIIFIHPAATHGVLLELCEAVERER